MKHILDYFLIFIFLTFSVLNFAFGAAETKTDAKYAPNLRVTKNFVKNPDCEFNVLNITSSTTPANITQNTSSPLVAGAGAQCRWNPGASGATLKFDIDTLSPHVKAGDCEAVFYTGTTTAGQYVAYLEYDSVQVTSDLAVNATVAGQRFSIAAPCNPSVNTRKLVIKTTTSPGALSIGGVSFGAFSTIPIYLVKPPTVQRFFYSDGTAKTYTTPSGVLYLKVKVVGGGGGGSGSGGTSPAAGAGIATTFGSSLLTAGGGSGAAGNAGNGGGGTATVNSPAIPIVQLNGQAGAAAYYGANAWSQGGDGGNNPMGGGAGGGNTNIGMSAHPHTGGGGGGAGNNGADRLPGSGGGAGAYIEAIIPNPSASYSYTVGAGGGGGAAGTLGFAGGAGASGYIEVTEYYQ